MIYLAEMVIFPARYVKIIGEIRFGQRHRRRTSAEEKPAHISS